MGLTEREKRTLEELERSLGAPNKPAKVRANRAGSRVLAGALLCVSGLVLLVSAALIKVSLLGLAGFVVMAGGVLLISKRG